MFVEANHLYSFPNTAVTNYNKLWLETTHIYYITVLESLTHVSQG